MSKIDQLKKLWAQADCILQVVNAPKDAQTFDKMLVVFVEQLSGKKIIRKVSLYNSKTDSIVAEY